MDEIVTFGSASWDVFMKSKDISVVKSQKFISRKGICFNLGSKVDIEDIYFSSGGGGTNVAATFENQGFKTAFVGIIGFDLSGKEVIKDLDKRKIDTRFILKTDKKPTNYSVILKTKKGVDRTILAFRGASEFLTKKDINWDKIKKSRWFYLAPLSGESAKITKDIISFAVKNRIKIAFNPGNDQLSLPKNILRNIINKVDILLLNQEETAILTKISYNKEREIFKKLDDICPGIAIMTKGPNGAIVSDGKTLFSAPGIRTKIIDNTGAGDAFGSGFVAMFIKSSGNIEEGIRLGLSNSISCIRKLGAKEGLLKKGDSPGNIKIKKEPCLGYNCRLK